MLTKCKFKFDTEAEVYQGFTDGTSWNGANNVWVTPEVHRKVVADFKRSWPEFKEDFDRDFGECLVDDHETEAGRLALVSYAYGFSTVVVG